MASRVAHPRRRASWIKLTPKVLIRTSRQCRAVLVKKSKPSSDRDGRVSQKLEHRPARFTDKHLDPAHLADTPAVKAVAKAYDEDIRFRSDGQIRG